MFGKKAETHPVIFFGVGGGGGETHNHVHHEHRAPTDGSIRLAQEMEEMVRASLMHSIKVENAVIPMHLLAMKNHDMSMGLCLDLILVLHINDERHTISHRMSEIDIKMNQKAVLEIFHGKVADYLASVMLEASFNSATKEVLDTINSMLK